VKTTVSQLKSESGELTTCMSDRDTAEVLCRYFHSVFTKDDFVNTTATTDNVNCEDDDFVSNDLTDSFCVSAVLAKLTHLKEDKSPEIWMVFIQQF